MERLARQVAERAHVPYSGRHEAAILVLSDGRWIPGVRVESASFSLTISPLLNALTSAATAGRRDVAGVVLSRPFLPHESVMMRYPPLDRLVQTRPAVYAVPRASMPSLTQVVDPFVGTGRVDDPASGIRLARDIAGRAYVPDSDFPVGCVLQMEGGGLVAGVNVEHEDWSRVLCAERNALGTAVSYGLGNPKALYLTCIRDPLGTPCGACRQLISELAQGSTLWMDRGDEPPEASAPGALLPGSFSGTSIPKKL